jgi:hypothetical protein
LDRLAVTVDIFITYIAVELLMFSRFTHNGLLHTDGGIVFFFFNALNLGQFLLKNKTTSFPAEVSLKGGFAALLWKSETKRW